MGVGKLFAMATYHNCRKLEKSHNFKYKRAGSPTQNNTML